MMIHIPYEFLENVFGKTIADNFNTISACLFVVGFMIAAILRSKTRR